MLLRPLARLEVLMIAVPALLLLVVLEMVRRRKLREDYSLLWLATFALLVILSTFRTTLLDSVAELLGIFYPPTALFVIGFGLMLLILLQFSMVITQLSRQSSQAAQHIALLNLRIGNWNRRSMMVKGNRLLVETNRIKIDRFAWIVLAIGLVVQIAIILIFFRTSNPEASDGNYYILIAREPARLLLTTDAPVYSVGPIYPIFLIPFYQLIPESTPIAQAVAVRIAQAVLSSLIALFVYLIAKRLFGEQTGRVALVAQALDARYLFVTGTIATETLFIALFAGFMVAYLFAVSSERLRAYAGAGAILGIATLTRPIPIVFPIVLAIAALFGRATARRHCKELGSLRHDDAGDRPLVVEECSGIEWACTGI